MPAVDFAYSYPARSALDEAPAGLHLGLVSAADRAPASFLEARALQPQTTAIALRAVSEIVGARFYIPPAMLARILRAADPVATVGTERVRFEGFSACCSAYIRLDLGPEALDVKARRSGTTNVDFGPELRAALARVRDGSKLDIAIGPEAVAITHDGAAVTERKVPLPVRWIKGFGEVQVHMADMRPAFTLPRVAAQRFLRALPRSGSDHLQWLTATSQGIRSSTRHSHGAVPLRGAHRLVVLATLAAHSRDMTVFVNEALGSTAWRMNLGGQSLTLTLNAEPWRGFSGDGALLPDLARDSAGIAALRALLNWQDRIEPAEMSGRAGLGKAQTKQALARLAGLGLV
ncbi:MAG: SWIM zinc finger family protein, partial [Alphaproteobacteria bacterium]|nr:SWIM zinc finger family protein [Alphaproteobacteria bacterium]